MQILARPSAKEKKKVLVFSACYTSSILYMLVLDCFGPCVCVWLSVGSAEHLLLQVLQLLLLYLTKRAAFFVSSSEEICINTFAKKCRRTRICRNKSSVYVVAPHQVREQSKCHFLTLFPCCPAQNFLESIGQVTFILRFSLETEFWPFDKIRTSQKQ